jgi:hypothetical protein
MWVCGEWALPSSRAPVGFWRDGKGATRQQAVGHGRTSDADEDNTSHPDADPASPATRWQAVGAEKPGSGQWFYRRGKCARIAANEGGFFSGESFSARFRWFLGRDFLRFSIGFNLKHG